MATDAADNVYVVDTLNHRIQKFDSSGNFLTKWGSNGRGPGQFTFPYGVATSASGNVYVADSGNSRIEEFNSSGDFITQWGASGTSAGEFRVPRGIAVDRSDNVYVVDEANDRVQKFSPMSKIGKVTVTGPARVKQGKQASWKVRVENTGDGTATGVKLKVKGRGMGASLPIGDIPEEKSMSVMVRIKPRRIGRIKTTFKVTSANAGTKAIQKTIKVTSRQ